jgi:hypothetical protein
VRGGNLFILATFLTACYAFGNGETYMLIEKVRCDVCYKIVGAKSYRDVKVSSGSWNLTYQVCWECHPEARGAISEAFEMACEFFLGKKPKAKDE